jgi:hypothetical protein
MAAKIGHPALAMAQALLQGQKGDHGGRTCRHCPARTEHGTAGLLRTAVAYRRGTIDGACLLAEDINWEAHTICFTRKKLKSRGTDIKPTLFRFSPEIEAILKRRPATGPLFPYLCTVRAGDRATEFKQRCEGLGISGVSLHCYRYAWAGRALKCGFPERFAQQALGHNSKAVHRAYAKHAEVTVPSLADWEKDWQDNPQRGRKTQVVPVVIPSPMAGTVQVN